MGRRSSTPTIQTATGRRRAGIALPEGGDAGARADLGDRAGRGRHLYAGGDPGVLFESRDGGASWELNRSAVGAPDAAGLAAGRRRPVPALDRALAGRAGQARARDLRRRRLADRRRRRDLAPRQPGHPARATCPRARAETFTLCVHDLQRAPKRPERLFMQFHGGVYRSDDAGAAGRTSATGSRRDFGFPLVVDPADPDSAYVIPLKADMDRVTPEGHVRVYETRDAGATLGAARRRPPGRARLPDGPARGVRPAWRGGRARAVLRRDLGRRLRLGRRRRDLVLSGDPPSAGLLGPHRLSGSRRPCAGWRRRRRARSAPTWRP